ncbi:type II toxin-antitoxin system PemK/MazF family toxin [Aerococcus viridans]|uniref:type II toxin-antitoxin system PemK/MazF family toxin n=1 Tax=Aerococcus viridans TaxID=1377 RepID=UPI002DBF3DBD|nr:type II toxin-antitoxin system PemK/MazF family toxin [Aerococcus viridans]MEC1387348.1 type II toxin-antitoxin system PemK/MazF family toxin [Aerococcus viridans]
MSKKRISQNPNLNKRAGKLTEELRLIVEKMDEKRGKIFLDWLEIQNKYLLWEESFNPMKLRKYKRGEVVLANFGFNVGAEYGGMHYAAIIKKDVKSNPIVNVIPLSSLKDGQTKDDLHPDEVFLGTIPELNEKEAFAIANQVRPVSKLRIFKPRAASDHVIKLRDDQMDLIDAQIIKMYTK